MKEKPLSMKYELTFLNQQKILHRLLMLLFVRTWEKRVMAISNPKVGTENVCLGSWMEWKKTTKFQRRKWWQGKKMDKLTMGDTFDKWYL